MKFLYTARGIYSKEYNGTSWNKFIEWSKLTQLTEVVSLDCMLNELLVEPDRNNDDDWNFIYNSGYVETSCYTTLEYVLSRLNAKDKFNLLCIVIEPKQNCKNIKLDDYNFVGYDLLDQSFYTSALSNCGGFDETFLPSELNNKGLIDDFEKAYDIKRKLLKNNPEEYHADTNVIAIWRHNIIGR